MSFKPSQVDIDIPPFPGMLGKAELEHALACLVYTCRCHGDQWQTTTLEMFQSAVRPLFGGGERLRAPFPAENLTDGSTAHFKALLMNPIFRPDFGGLLRAGHVITNDIDSSGPPLIITQKTLDLLETKWVRR